MVDFVLGREEFSLTEKLSSSFFLLCIYVSSPYRFLKCGFIGAMIYSSISETQISEKTTDMRPPIEHSAPTVT